MNLPVDGTSSKSLNPFTRALAPSFIGRRTDFYIPKTPPNSKNIPNVNTYKNVFFIQHIYKPATSSHSGLTFWDDNFDFASPPIREFLRARLPNQTSDRFPNQLSSEVRAFASSRFQASACS
jgi:hypothetical protein